jgi:hypothetical protein
MAAKKNEIYLTVINVDRDKLSICDTRSSATPVFTFPSGSVRDLEVVNHDLLASELKKFITGNNIAPGQVIFLLSPNIYFSKNLPNLSESERDSEIQKFLDTIPFASVSSRMFHIGNDYQIVAINRDYYESLRELFEQLGFSVMAAVPNFVVNSFGVKDTFDIETCRLILKKSDFILQNNFLTPSKPPPTFREAPRKFLNSNPILVIALCVVLVIGTGVIAFLTLRRPGKTAKPPVRVSQIQRTAPPETELVASESGIIVDKKDLTVQVLNGSNLSGVALKVQKQLEEIGFTNIEVGNSSASAQNTLVVYSPRVSRDIRDQIDAQIKETFNIFSVRDSSEPSYDVFIITGKLD